MSPTAKAWDGTKWVPVAAAAVGGNTSLRSTNAGPGSAASAAWLVLGLPTAWESKGDAAQRFTIGADRITIMKDGVYAISATVDNSDSGGAVTRKIARLCTTATVAGSPYVVGDERNAVAGAFPGHVLAVTAWFAAGTVLTVQSYSASATSRGVIHFAIAEVSGPKGDKGESGMAGELLATGVVETNVGGGQTVPTGVEVGRNLLAGTDWRLVYTPTVNAWLDFEWVFPQITKSVAGWGYIYCDIYLVVGSAALPAVGGFAGRAPSAHVTRQIVSMYGTGGSTHAALLCRKIVPLTAGGTVTLAPYLNHTGSFQIDGSPGLQPALQWKAWKR